MIPDESGSGYRVHGLTRDVRGDEIKGQLRWMGVEKGCDGRRKRESGGIEVVVGVEGVGRDLGVEGQEEEGGGG